MKRDLKQKLMAVTALGFAVFAAGCPKSTNTSTTSASSKTLYVASGLCYSGTGITTYTQTTASRAVTKWSTTNGAALGTFTDLNQATSVSVNTVPQALIDKGDYVLMLTENATTMGDRKIFKIKKNDPGTYITYANDPTAFNAVAANITRSMSMDTDGTLIFSKSVGAERLNTVGARLVKGGANPWINPLAATGNCFTAAGTLISKVTTIAPFSGQNQGKTIYLHAGATAVLNRIGAVQRTGLTSATAADCAGSSPAGGASTVVHVNGGTLSGPVALAATGSSLTSMVYIPTPSPATTTGKLLVTYAPSVVTQFDNNTTFNTGIVSWDVTETSDTAITFANPTIIWRDDSVVWAPSAMTYDASTSSIYVAVGGAPGVINQTTGNYGYNIEKFSLDTTSFLLTRVSANNQPFITGNAYTKCITDLAVGD